MTDVIYEASATDVNGDGLVYSLSGPDAHLMEIDELTGLSGSVSSNPRTMSRARRCTRSRYCGRV